MYTATTPASSVTSADVNVTTLVAFITTLAGSTKELDISAITTIDVGSAATFACTDFDITAGFRSGGSLSSKEQHITAISGVASTHPHKEVSTSTTLRITANNSHRASIPIGRSPRSDLDLAGHTERSRVGSVDINHTRRRPRAGARHHSDVSTCGTVFVTGGARRNAHMSTLARVSFTNANIDISATARIGLSSVQVNAPRVAETGGTGLDGDCTGCARSASVCGGNVDRAGGGECACARLERKMATMSAISTATQHVNIPSVVFGGGPLPAASRYGNIAPVAAVCHVGTQSFAGQDIDLSAATSTCLSASRRYGDVATIAVITSAYHKADATSSTIQSSSGRNRNRPRSTTRRHARGNSGVPTDAGYARIFSEHLDMTTGPLYTASRHNGHRSTRTNEGIPTQHFDTATHVRGTSAIRRTSLQNHLATISASFRARTITSSSNKVAASRGTSRSIAAAQSDVCSIADCTISGADRYGACSLCRVTRLENQGTGVGLGRRSSFEDNRPTGTVTGRVSRCDLDRPSPSNGAASC